MGNNERERASNSVLESSMPGSGADIGRTNAVANRMRKLIKLLEANGECAVFGGPWFEQLQNK